jgi:rhodanese-related sulfurtransferase
MAKAGTLGADSAETSVEGLADEMAQGGVAVFDANPPSRWRSGHVPGAVKIDPAGDTAAELPEDRPDRLVFYCREPSCRAAPPAAKHARQWGHQNFAVLRAGLAGWEAANQPVDCAGQPAS